MRKNIIRAVAIVLSAMIMFGTAACGGNPSSNNSTNGGTTGSGSNTGSTDNSGASDTASSSVSAGGPLDPFSEPVTITWAVATTSGQEFFDSDTWDDNRWTRKLKEELNIDLKIAMSVDSADYDERLKTLLVSNDLPDIFHTYDRPVLIEAQRGGQIREIGTLLDSYATPAVNEYRDLFPDSFDGGKIDGVQYGFPSMNDNFHSANYLWIRDDWLENTNSQAPQTMDEFIELARKFTFGDPNNDGGATKTYGMAMTSTVVDNIAGLIGAYGVPSAMWGGLYYERDGKITYSWIQPEVKIVLEMLHNFYKEGIIDPEFFVKDGGALETDIARHSIGMYDYRNWGTWYPFNIIYDSDKVISRPYPIPKVPGIDYKIGVANNYGGILFLLSSKCEYAEAYVKIINLFNKVCFESTDPKDFEDYWDNGQASLVPVKPIVPNEIYAPDIHDAIARGSGDHLPAAIRPFYDFTINFENGTDTSGSAYGTWGQNFERGSMAIALYDYKGDNALVENVYGMNGFIPESALEVSGVLATIMDTAFVDIVVGNKPVDSFDTFVADWLNNGGQRILDEMNAFYSN